MDRQRAHWKAARRFDSVSATWTVRVDGVSSPSWTFEDGRHQLDLHRILNVSLDAVRGRAAWRTLPALIPNPWTAHSHIVISLPDSGGGVDLSGGEDRELAIPAVEWRRKISRSGAQVAEDITLRESGVEIPADQISGTLKAIHDATAKTVHGIKP
jgi:hypothetical protein